MNNCFVRVAVQALERVRHGDAFRGLVIVVHAVDRIELLRPLRRQRRLERFLRNPQQVMVDRSIDPEVPRVLNRRLRLCLLVS